MDLKLLEMSIEDILSLQIETFYAFYPKLNKYMETCHMDYASGQLYYMQGEEEEMEWIQGLGKITHEINKFQKEGGYTFYIISEE